MDRKTVLSSFLFLLISGHMLISLFSSGNLTPAFSYADSETISSSSADLLVITNSDLEEQVISYSAYRNSTGIRTLYTTVQRINSTYPGRDLPEKIRKCINETSKKHGIDYVLILGDNEMVPTRLVYIPYGNEPDADGLFVESDLYYADMQMNWDDNDDGLWGDLNHDIVDGIPDLCIGRLPVSNPDEAAIVVNKIINYENNVNLSSPWFNRILLLGEDICDFAEGSEGEILSNYIQTKYVGSSFTTKKLYESYGNLTVNDVKSQIEEGFGFINYVGHGDVDNWNFVSGGSYNIMDVLEQNNGYKLPIIVTTACSSSSFYDTESIGKKFITNPNGGAIAYLGPTRLSYINNGECVTYGLSGEIDWRFFKTYFDGWSVIGDIWAKTITEYILNHAITSAIDWKTVVEYGTPFMDPTLAIGGERKKNIQMRVTGGEEIKIENIFFVQTGDIIVEDNATLIIKDVTLSNDQTWDFQHSFVVKDNGKLVIDNMNIFNIANHNFYMIVLNSGSIVASDTGIPYLLSCGTTQISVYDSHVSHIIGHGFSDFLFKNAIISWSDLYGSSQMLIHGSESCNQLQLHDNSKIETQDSNIEQLYLSGLSSAILNFSELRYYFRFSENAKVNLTLPDDYSKYWNIHQNCSITPELSYNLTLINSKATWSIIAGGNSHVSIYNSSMYNLDFTGTATLEMFNCIVEDAIICDVNSLISIYQSVVKGRVVLFPGCGGKGASRVLVQDSLVGINLGIPNTSEATLRLQPGYVTNWDEENNITWVKNDVFWKLTLRNSNISQWSVYCYDSSSLVFEDSVLNQLYSCDSSLLVISHSTIYWLSCVQSLPRICDSFITIHDSTIDLITAYSLSSLNVTNSNIGSLKCTDSVIAIIKDSSIERGLQGYNNAYIDLTDVDTPYIFDIFDDAFVHIKWHLVVNVLDQTTKEPIVGATVEVYSYHNDSLASRQLTDTLGKAYFLLPGKIVRSTRTEFMGEYMVKIIYHGIETTENIILDRTIELGMDEEDEEPPFIDGNFLYVPNDYETIDDALGIANKGDTIFLNMDIEILEFGADSINLVITNSVINDLTCYEDTNVIINSSKIEFLSVRWNSNITVLNSHIHKIFTKGVILLNALDSSFDYIYLKDCGEHIFTLSNSSLELLYLHGKYYSGFYPLQESLILFNKSNINGIEMSTDQILPYEGVLRFDESKLKSLVLNDSNITLSGDLELERVILGDGTFTREYSVHVMEEDRTPIPDVSLSLLDENENTIWSGFTDKNGATEFSISFTDDDYKMFYGFQSEFSLRITLPDAYESMKVPVTALMKTPLVIASPGMNEEREQEPEPELENPLRPAEFEVSDLTIAPVKVEPGKEVEISILVKNIGEQQGSYMLSVLIENGQILSWTSVVDLEGGTNETVRYSFIPEAEGNYNVDFNDLTGSFTVKPEPSFWDKIPGFQYESIIIGIIAGIIILWRFRKF